MIPLSVIPWRLIGILAVLAALGGLLWHDNYVTKKLNATRVELKQANANLAASIRYRQTEIDDRRRADESAKSLQDELDRINRLPKPVSVFCRPASVPATSGQGHAAPGADGASIGASPEAPLRDIGAAVEAVRIEHQSNAARQRALMKWEQDRTH